MGRTNVSWSDDVVAVVAPELPGVRLTGDDGSGRRGDVLWEQRDPVSHDEEGVEPERDGHHELNTG